MVPSIDPSVAIVDGIPVSPLNPFNNNGINGQLKLPSLGAASSSSSSSSSSSIVSSSMVKTSLSLVKVEAPAEMNIDENHYLGGSMGSAMGGTISNDNNNDNNNDNSGRSDSDNPNSLYAVGAVGAVGGNRGSGGHGGEGGDLNVWRVERGEASFVTQYLELVKKRYICMTR